jgi:hypothetical protein
MTAATVETDTGYCPECGQSLSLIRARRRDRGIVAWRSIFVLGVGLYLAVTFGLAAGRAAQRIQDVHACPSAERRADCVALPPEVASPVASRNLATGEAFAAPKAELELEHDVRYSVVGLAGLIIGLRPALFRLKRLRRLALVGRLWLTVEGLLAVFYVEVLALGTYQLAVDSASAGVPLTLGLLEDSLFRALSLVFALVGVQ